MQQSRSHSTLQQRDDYNMPEQKNKTIVKYSVYLEYYFTEEMYSQTPATHRTYSEDFK